MKSESSSWEHSDGGGTWQISFHHTIDSGKLRPLCDRSNFSTMSESSDLEEYFTLSFVFIDLLLTMKH